MIDIYNVLLPKVPPAVKGARTIVFDTTPMADRSYVEELQDRDAMADFRIARVRKALSSGCWTTQAQIERRTRMHHAQVKRVLGKMLERRLVEFAEYHGYRLAPVSDHKREIQERQVQAILSMLDELCIDPLRVPYGMKKRVGAALILRHPDLFSEDIFKRAWQGAVWA